MSEAQLLEYFKATLGPGVVAAAIWIGRALAKGVAKLAPIIIEAIAEMKNLRSEMETVKKLGPRVDKLEVDTHEAFKRIRTIEKGEL